MALTRDELISNISSNIFASKRPGSIVTHEKARAKAKAMHECVEEILRNQNAGSTSDAEIEAYIRRYRANNKDNGVIDFKKLETQLNVDNDLAEKKFGSTDKKFNDQVFGAARRKISESFSLFAPEPTVQANTVTLMERVHSNAPAAHRAA